MPTPRPARRRPNRLCSAARCGWHCAPDRRALRRGGTQASRRTRSEHHQRPGRGSRQSGRCAGWRRCSHPRLEAQHAAQRPFCSADWPASSRGKRASAAESSMRGTPVGPRTQQPPRSAAGAGPSAALRTNGRHSTRTHDDGCCHLRQPHLSLHDRLGGSQKRSAAVLLQSDDRGENCVGGS